MHSLAVVSLMLVALVGHPLEVSEGWVVCPPQVIELAGVVGRPRQGRPKVGLGADVGAGWAYWQHTWLRVLARSELLAVMWLLSSRWLPGWVPILPWVE